MDFVAGITHPEHRNNWAFYILERVQFLSVNAPSLAQREHLYGFLVNQGYSKDFAFATVYE